MFEQALLEHSIHSSWDEHSRRGLTTLTSFGLQALAVGAVLVLPLLRPTGMPLLRPLSTPISLGQPPSEPNQPERRASGGNPANTQAIIFLRQPPHLPLGMPRADNDTQPPTPGSGPYIPGIGSTGDPYGALGALGMGTRPIIPVAPVAPARPVRLSHMSEGDLVRKVLPAYPPLARSARIQGAVELQAIISKQGTIENLRLLNGHPMLAPAAIEAVRQWRYRPYILNNEPVEVETQITVNFSLTGN